MTVTPTGSDVALGKIKTKKKVGTPVVLREGQRYVVTLSRVKPSGRMTFALRDIDEMKHHRHLVDIKNSNFAMKINPADIHVGLVVIVFDEKSDAYFRGQILTEPDKEKKVLVLSLDTGHVIRRGLDSFFYISKEYLLEPFESFECHLDGLTFFESTQNTQILRNVLAANKSIFDGELVATLKKYEKDDIPSIWLESGCGDAKFALNNKLLEDVYSRCPGLFPTKNETVQKFITVSYYDTTPDIFIHFAEESFVFALEDQINKVSLETLLTKGRPLEIEELTLKAIYLAPFDDALYRVTCVKTTPVGGSDEDPLIEVTFIDYGNKSNVALSKIRSAGVIDPHLVCIPPMCHKVHLKWVQTVLDIDKFSEAIDGKSFAIDIRQPLPDGSPVVALHRVNPDGTTDNLNKELVKKHICKGYSVKSTTGKAK